MPRTVKAEIDVPGRIAEAEALWYEVRRWPSFVDGFGHVDKAEGDWPAAGSRVRWVSRPNGRGVVDERVEAYEPRVRQVIEVEDEKIRGTQEIRFEGKEGGGVKVRLSLTYELKHTPFLPGIGDVLFIRRAWRDSLRHSLVRFARELASDREPVG